jgi:hypothetical protein
MTLCRLVLTFTPEGVELRALYRGQDGPNPGTKARGREVAGLVRIGLRQALVAHESSAECVGTSGFTTREDVLLAQISPDTGESAKGE